MGEIHQRRVGFELGALRDFLRQWRLQRGAGFNALKPGWAGRQITMRTAVSRRSL